MRTADSYRAARRNLDRDRGIVNMWRSQQLLVDDRQKSRAKRRPTAVHATYSITRR